MKQDKNSMNARKPLVKGDINNLRVIQVSQTFLNGKMTHETILKVWECEWQTVRTAESKIKNLTEEKKNLGNGSWNTVKHMVVNNGKLNKMVGE